MKIPESLEQFMLFENMQEAERIFAKMDVSTNDPDYIDFFETLEDDPEFAGNVAKWIQDGENWDDIKIYFDRAQTLDIHPDKFISLEEYKKKIREESAEERKRRKEEKAKIVSEDPPKQEIPDKRKFISEKPPREVDQKKIKDEEKYLRREELEDEDVGTKKAKEINHFLSDELKITPDFEKHHFSPKQVRELEEWFLECQDWAEKYPDMTSIPEKYVYKLGGEELSDDDIKNHNCEADYLWAYEIGFLNSLKSGLKPIIKSGSASGTGDPFKTIRDTASREALGKKIILSVFYAPRKKHPDGTPDDSDLDKKYHPIMRASHDIYFSPVRKKPGAGEAGTEMFYFDYNPNVKEIKKKAIEEVLHLDESGGYRKLNPNKLQETPSKEINERLEKKDLDDDAITVFLGYKCRFPGKTITVLEAFSKSKSKYLIVFSRRKNIAESWERNSKFFSNMIFISLREFIELDISKLDQSKKYLIVGTVQSLESRDDGEGEENQFPEEALDHGDQEEALNNEKLDEYFNEFLDIIGDSKFWIGLDEAHQGGIAPNTSAILKKFSSDPQCQVRWDISGTGLKLFRASEYDVDYHYDIINEEEDREKYLHHYNLKYSDNPAPYSPENLDHWVKTIEGINFSKDPDARVILSPKKLTYVMDHEFLDPGEKQDIYEKGQTEGGIPIMIHLLSQDDNGKTRFENSVGNMVEWILGEGDYKDATGFNKKFDKGFINEKNRSFFDDWGFMIFVSRVKNGEVLERAFKKYGRGRVDVIQLCGRYMSQQEINIRISHSIMEGRKPIIISCGSHGEGSDFEQIIATFHLDNGTSGENKTQRGFRGATPFLGKARPEDKKIFKSQHFDVYFDMSQALKINADEIIKAQKDSDGKDLSHIIPEYLKANPLYSVGLKLERIEEDEYQKAIRDSINFEKIKDSIFNLDFDLENLPSDFFNDINPKLISGKLREIIIGSGEEHASGDRRGKDDSEDEDKEPKERKSKSDEDKKKEAFKKFIENLIRALYGFTTRPYFSLNNFLTIEDLYENLSDDSFVANLGVSKDVYKELIKDEVINRNSLNQFLSTRPRFMSSTRLNIKEIGLEKTIKRISEELVQKALNDPLSLFVGTKFNIVKEMWGKISHSLEKLSANEKKNLRILDPEIKNGEFLLWGIYIMDGLLKNEIKKDQERIQWIIDHNLFGSSGEETNLEGFILLLKDGIFKGLDLDFSKLRQRLYHINLRNPKDLSEKLKSMPKFDVVIGNPPYTAPKAGGGESRSEILYTKFVELSYEISKRYSMLLIPFRWSKIDSLRDFRKKMFKDFDISFIRILNPGEIWPGQVSLASYVCYYLSNKENPPSNIIKIEELDGSVINFDTDKNDFYIKDPIINEILEKIDYSNNMASYYQRPQYIHTDGKIFIGKLREKVEKNEFKGSLPVIASKNRIFYTDPKYFGDKIEKYKLEDYKLIVPVVYGGWYNGFSPSVEVFGRNYLTTQSNIFFPFKTREEAENCKSYLNTKFSIFLKNIIQADRAFSQHVFQFIPYMGFSRSWNDEELFDHFDLSDEQRDYIRRNYIVHDVRREKK